MIISVWAKFDDGSANSDQLKADGAMYPELVHYVFPKGQGHWYDPFNPIGRRDYWEQISKDLFAKGLDGWWLDASEPELGGKWGEFRNYTTAAGPGPLVFNAYPLMHTTGVYEGQRAESPDKRVFILTRSAYAGQQRNSAVSWSGDIEGTWKILSQNIANGINFSMSGIPYWNTDTGGFFTDNPYDPKYPELFARWFQFSSFCPMFRVHGDAGEFGDRPGKEMWNFPADIETILIAYDNLRYHLLPYIYSVAWNVTSANGTMMRGLVMDFPKDRNVYDIGGQYLFGPDIMVTPVTQPGVQTWPVYLPAGTGWTDFWTGQTSQGGQTIQAATPLQTMPLYVRAGSILPYGPRVQSSADKADPLELRIYPGANGSFTLYEDEGDNYNYEKGVYATIAFHWNDKTGTLTIGKRHGSFPGMLEKRTFHIVRVGPNHGAGLHSTAKADVELAYNGQESTVSLPAMQ
jgi:alpha-D-xyloside xylohydrolase